MAFTLDHRSSKWRDPLNSRGTTCIIAKAPKKIPHCFIHIKIFEPAFIHILASCIRSLWSDRENKSLSLNSLAHTQQFSPSILSVFNNARLSKCNKSVDIRYRAETEALYAARGTTVQTNSLGLLVFFLVEIYVWEWESAHYQNRSRRSTHHACLCMLKGATLPACHIQTFVISSSWVCHRICVLFWVSTTGRIVFVAADNAEWLRFIIYCA